MSRRIVISSFGVTFFSIYFIFFLTLGETKPVGFATPFPDLTFTQILSKGEQFYLGIPPKKTFSIKEIRGNLILIEFISTYCVSCQRQAPIINELYSSIEKDPRLKGKER